MESEPSKQTASASTPRWSFQIAKISDIPIRIHFTFVFFLVWIGLAGEQYGSLLLPLLVLTMFACIVLHELGHALTALHYGIKTRDITLYPIGGIAMLLTRPKPKQEFWIALAGPCVNLFISGVLFLAEMATGAPKLHLPTDVGANSFMGNVLIGNAGLALFNLIPAFPMDGGRVLRSALATGMSDKKATHIAASIGQALAMAIGIGGLFTGQIMVVLVAFFVFIGAGQEDQASFNRSFLMGHVLRDAMQTKFQVIRHGDSLETAAEMLLESSQESFPVVAGEELVGILNQNDIVRGLSSGNQSLYVSDVMQRTTKQASPDMPLEEVMGFFADGDRSPVLVLEDGKLTGVVTSGQISEFIMLASARSWGKKSR